MNELSVSDLEELDAAVKMVASLTPGQIRRLTHEDPAYIEAWKRKPKGKKKSDIDYKQLIERRESVEEVMYTLSLA